MYNNLENGKVNEKKDNKRRKRDDKCVQREDKLGK